MNLNQVINFFLNDPYFSQQIKHCIRIPEKLPEYKDFPSELDPRLVEALKKRNINKLYLHQYQAYEMVKKQKKRSINNINCIRKNIGFYSSNHTA